MNIQSRRHFLGPTTQLVTGSLFLFLAAGATVACEKPLSPNGKTKEAGQLLPRPQLEMPKGAQLAEAVAERIEKSGRKAYVVQVLRPYALDPWRSPGKISMMTAWVVQLTPERMPQPQVSKEVSAEAYVFEIVESATEETIDSNLQGNLYNLSFSDLVNKVLEEAKVSFHSYVNKKRVVSPYEVFAITAGSGGSKSAGSKSQKWNHTDFGYDASKATFVSIQKACEEFMNLTTKNSQGYHFEAAASCIGPLCVNLTGDTCLFVFKLMRVKRGFLNVSSKSYENLFF